MKRIWIYSLMLCAAVVAGRAQEARPWTMDDCMRYAAENSLKVRAGQHRSDTYSAEYRAAVAGLFPSVGARIGGQLNYGRSIDPQTNTYNNVSTFNNSYAVYASLPLFDGGQLINEAKAARINRLLGGHELRRAQDEAALAVMEAFANVLYYGGTVRLASEKLDESSRMLHKTQRMEELGMKGAADVAQMAAQMAADDYNLTHQRNLCDAAVRTLKEAMNYPTDKALVLDTVMIAPPAVNEEATTEEIFLRAKADNPTMQAAECRQQAARYQYRVARGAMLPQLTFEVGITTNYFRNLADQHTTAFSKQFFDNNRGEYLALTLSIPLFDGLSRYTSARRARNTMRLANTERDETLRQLRTAVEQAVADREGFAKEAVQMQRKVEADSIAYRVTLRKYEEGLSSAIDLQTAANTLLEARANLLQKQLSYEIKRRLVAYYQGEGLATESKTTGKSSQQFNPSTSQQTNPSTIQQTPWIYN